MSRSPLLKARRCRPKWDGAIVRIGDLSARHPDRHPPQPKRLGHSMHVLAAATTVPAVNAVLGGIPLLFQQRRQHGREGVMMMIVDA
jgi:hypothetical protein